MAKNWFDIRNENGIPQIKIFGYIGPYDEVDYESFRSQFSELEKTYNTIELCFHCGGGSMFEGMPIADMVANSKANTIGIGEGMIASMAGPIFLACKVRKQMPSSMVMVHRPQGGFYGEADGMRSAADLQDDLEKRVVAFMVKQTGQKEDTVKSWMKPGVMTWFNAEKCVDLGITHEIIQGPANAPKLPKNITNKRPDEVFAIYNKVLNTQPEMNKFKILMLGLFGQFNIKNTLSEADDEQKFVDAVSAELKAKTARITELENKLKEKDEAAAKTLVENAVAAGKITEEQKEGWMELAKNNYDLAAKTLGVTLAPAATQPTTPDINSLLKNGGKKPEEGDGKNPRSQWTIVDWQQKDHVGLAKMKREEFEKYSDLFEAEYGEKPTK